MRNALAVLLLGLVFAVGCWRQAPPATPPAPPPAVMTELPPGPAIDFGERAIEEYKDNPVRADLKYKGKRVRIASKVAGVKQLDGRPAATFFRYYGIETDGEPQVLCIFDSPADVAKLNANFPTELEGVVVGRVNDGIDRGLPGSEFHVRVEGCRLVSR